MPGTPANAAPHTSIGRVSIVLDVVVVVVVVVVAVVVVAVVVLVVDDFLEGSTFKCVASQTDGAVN